MSDDFKEAMKRVYGSDRSINTKEKGNKKDENEVKKEESKEEIGVKTEELKKEIHDSKVKEILKKIYGSARFISESLKSEEPKKISSEDAKKIKEEVLKEIQEKKDKQITAVSEKEVPKEIPREEKAAKGELSTSVNPHIRDKRDVRRIMWVVVIALLPASIASIYFFGIKALWIILLGVVSALATEFLIYKFTKKEITVMDGSAVITGLLLALILPPTVPFWIPILGAAFAIAIGKMVFGGLGHNIFNPALVGRAFLVASFPAIMIKWILPDGVTGATPLGLLKLEGVKTGYMQLFIGNIGGTIGETSAIALLIGAAFLFYKKIINWRIPTAYILTVAVFALIFRQDPLFHILAGGLLIGAFFMATDYVTSPLTKNGKLIFGFGCGFLTIILRLFSGYPEGVMFAILLMNSVTPLIDRFTKTKPFGYVSEGQKKKREKQKTEEEQIKAKVAEMLKKKDENQ